jgi:hypothetical protein
MALSMQSLEFDPPHFGATFDQLVHSGRIDDLRLIDVPIYRGADRGDPDQFAHVAVFEVT